MGRYLDLRGDDENPLQGLSLDGSSPRPWRLPSKPVAVIDSVTNYDLWARVDGRSATRVASFARFGAQELSRDAKKPPTHTHTQMCKPTVTVASSLVGVGAGVLN